MKALSAPKFTVKTAILILLLFALAIRPCYRWFSYEIMDYDEAGQFWMAKGLNHYSDPYAPCGTVSDVLKNNRFYNQDPGGFGVLLHFWSFFSNDINFLRCLPILFYLCFVLGVFLLGKALFKNLYLAILLAVFVTLPQPAEYFHYLSIPFTASVGRIRAYTMELCGIVWSLWFFLRIKDNMSYKELLLLSLILSFFCTSRYGFIIVAFVISLRVIYLIYKQDTLIKIKVRKLFTFSIPLVATVLYIYWSQMRFQNSNASLPPYYQSIYTNPEFLLGWGCFSIYLTTFYYLICKIKNIEINEFIRLTLWIGYLFFALSCLNKYPWGPLGQTPINPVLIMTEFSIIYIIVRACQKIVEKYIATAIVFVLLCLNVFLWISAIKKEPDAKGISEIKSVIDDKVYVGAGMNGVCRYLFEFGELKEVGYPDNFYFQRGIDHPSLLYGYEGDKNKFAFEENTDKNDYKYALCEFRMGETPVKGFIKIGKFLYVNPSKQQFD